MVDQKLEKENNIDSAHGVENALTTLWEKAREASYLITTLQDERIKLQTKVNELEGELQSAKNEILLKDSQLEKMSTELRTKLKAETNGIDEDEKRMLRQKIKNILGTLDQYLST